jgi:hypothetical protein
LTTTKRKHFDAVPKNIYNIKSSFEEVIGNYTDSILSDNIEINCNSKKNTNSEIYVNVDGIVLPCCFIGNSIDAFDNQPHALQLKTRFREYGEDHFNLNKNSITTILNEDHLNLFAASGWDTPQCLEFCKKTCGNSHIIKRIYDIK